MTITTVFTPFTDPPDTNDSANFDLRADNLFNVELPRLVNIELASFVPEVNSTAQAVNLNAQSALNSAQTAQAWASLLNGLVLNTDYSAKEWAVGTFVPAGSSKNWAVQLGLPVDEIDYSAKEWAVGEGTPDGSAKFWSNLAQVASGFQGDYDPGRIYTLGQQVVFSGVRFVAKRTVQGVEPVSGLDWYEVPEGIVVEVVDADISYPLVFSSSAVNGTTDLLIDGSSGTYNPSTNSASINITGNAATANSANTANTANSANTANTANSANTATTATNQSGGTVDATTIVASGDVQLKASVTLGDAGTDITTLNSQLSAGGSIGGVGYLLVSRGQNTSPKWEFKPFSAF